MRFSILVSFINLHTVGNFIKIALVLPLPADEERKESPKSRLAAEYGTMHCKSSPVKK
jgi:hypothetical protein